MMTGSDDDQINVLRSINENIANLRTALESVVGQPNATIVPIVSLATVASVSIDIPADTALFELFIWSVQPVTDGANLHLRGINNDTVMSGASDYSWANLKAATHTNDGADAQMVLGAGLDSALGSGLKVTITRPRQQNSRKMAIWQGVMMDSAASLPMTWSGGGRFENATINNDALTGVQLLMSSGNFNTLAYSVRYTPFTAT